MRSRFNSAILAPLVTLILLGWVWAGNYTMAPADAEPYHQRIRELSDQIPEHVGTWMSSESPITPSAVALLKPNVLMSRRYQDLATGKVATLMLIHCKDARDLLGHWPPVCYVGQGWLNEGHSATIWRFDDLEITGFQYDFTSFRNSGRMRLHADGFFILPDGRFSRHMNEVGANASDRRKKQFGAAQIQLLTDGSLSVSEREAILRMFVHSARPTIDAIRQGVPQ